MDTRRLFISYSREDAEFALKLAKDLRASGTNLWLDQLDIPPGDRWDRAVEEALKACPYLLVILSPASVLSHNVMDEVSYGLGENKKILPVLYRACDIPFRLKRLQYVDFTANYDAACTQLRRALTADAPVQMVREMERGGEVQETQTGWLKNTALDVPQIRHPHNDAESTVKESGNRGATFRSSFWGGIVGLLAGGLLIIVWANAHPPVPWLWVFLIVVSGVGIGAFAGSKRGSPTRR